MLVKLSAILALSGIASAVHTPPQARAAAAKKEAERRQLHPALIPGGIIENIHKLPSYQDDKKRQADPEEAERRQLHPALIPGGVIENIHKLPDIHDYYDKRQPSVPSPEDLQDLPELFVPSDENGDERHAAVEARQH